MNNSLNEMRDELAQQNQRGITFILAAGLYWLGIGLAGMYLPPQTAFIAAVWGTGLLFPASILFARIMRVNIFFKNGLTPLGIWANVFQLFFFPVFFASADADIQYPPIFMGVLAGAHFVFYHWLYRSRTYLLMAFAVSLNSYITGYLFHQDAYQIVGCSNAGILFIGSLLLAFENRALIIIPSTNRNH